MILGITGHQHLPDPAMWEWVASILDQQISQFAKPLVGVTCLAVGADQLFAQIILQHGGRLVFIKPLDDYENTFDPTGSKTYQQLTKRAEIQKLPAFEDEEQAFLEAGKIVVDRSDILFAVWNGLPPGGKGGTADIVAYASHRNLKVIHLNPITQKVVVIGAQA